MTYARKIAAGFLLLLAGCAADSRNAPPVSAGMLAVAARRHVAPESLAAGRAIYARRCTECHSLQPLEKFDAPKAAAVLDDMSRRAKLNDPDKRALLDYLRIAREVR